jgi:PPM family protein phosphatase
MQARIIYSKVSKFLQDHGQLKYASASVGAMANGSGFPRVGQDFRQRFRLTTQLNGDGQISVARFEGQDRAPTDAALVRLLVARTDTPGANMLQSTLEALTELDPGLNKRLVDSGQDRRFTWAVLSVPIAPTLRTAWDVSPQLHWLDELCRSMASLDSLGWTFLTCDPDELLMVDDRPFYLDLANAAPRPLSFPARVSRPYAAPEVFEAPESIDVRTGIYAIGACWLSLALGEPLNGRHLTATGLRQLSAKDPTIDPALSRTIARACQADPARRYESITQFRQVMISPWSIPLAAPQGVTMLSDVGLYRNSNEDTLWADYLAPKRLVLLLADGMGGAVGGARASRLAVETIRQVISRLADVGNEVEIIEALRVATNKASAAIYELASTNTSLRGMGTTIVGCLIDEATRRVYLVNVGDSLALQLKGTEITLRSEEHTVTGEMVADGSLSMEDALDHPHYGRLLRNLGYEPTVESYTTAFTLDPDSHLILCSDGLTSVVRPSELGQTLATSSSAGEAARRLVNLANQRQGPDNVSLIIV